MADDEPKTTNILCLDGGGVRGLSTLLILRRLLCLVNLELNHENSKYSNQPLLPLDVFDTVVGTSTGGLIALMIVKLGMDVDQCIKAYEELSKEIFSHRHVLSIITFGFGRVKKYCGTRLRRVLVEKVIKPNLDRNCRNAENYYMGETATHRDHGCTVVCRELDPEREDDAVLLCSNHEDQALKCIHSKARIRVADAARATSAAPTYFSHVKLIGKYLVDGGFGHTNNPSHETWMHYFTGNKKKYRRIQMVNIGTGSKSKKPATVQDTPQRIPKHWLEDVKATIRRLKEIATDSDHVGKEMIVLAESSQELEFNRFSADQGGIHTIDLAQYKRMSEIRQLTDLYLKDEAVNSELKKVARELADTCLARQLCRRQSIRPIMEQQYSSIAVSSVRSDMISRDRNGLSAELPNDPGLTESSSFASGQDDIVSAAVSVQASKGFEAHVLPGKDHSPRNLGGSYGHDLTV